MPDIAQKDTLPDVTLETDSELRAWRTGALNVLLTVVSIVATLAITITIIQAIHSPEQWLAVLIFAIGYLLVIALAVFRHLDPRLRAWGLLIIGYVVGVLSFARGGLAGDGPMYILALPMLTMILVGVRSGLVTAALSLLIFAAFGVAAHLGWLVNWLIILDNPLTPAAWLEKGIDFAMLLLALVVLQWFFNRFQARILQASRERTTELGQAHALLQERAEELSQRAQRFEAIARISRNTMALLEPEEMLQGTAESIKEQFGFDAVAVYLVDESGGELSLHATAGATPEAGVRPEQLEAVAQTILSGALRVTQPTAEKAEGGLGRLVLPLKIRAQTIGALAVQTRGHAAFSAEDTAALQMLADQIATAIENARLFSESQASLRELNALYRQYTAGAWEEYVQSQPEAIHYSYGSLQCSAATWRTACEQARASGKAVAFAGDADDGEATRSLAVPIILRGLSLGVLGFHRPAGASAWRPEEIAMVGMIADRLALAVENIRLLENTQHQARQEQLVSEVTTRIRAPMDMDTILQTAVRELGQALGAGRVSFYLAPEEKTD